MKKLIYLAIFGLFICSSFTACLEDDCTATHTYQKFEGVYMSIEEIRSQIGIAESRVLETPGKIYAYGQYLFINEIGKGIHIFNNEDFANPINLGFLRIPGNYDLAIKDGILYADNSFDLLSFDISDINNPILVNIDEGVYQNIHGNGNIILLYYDKSEVVNVSDCESQGYWYKRNGNVFISEAANLDFNLALSNTTSAESSNSNSGIGGSFARFTISGNYLYTVGRRTLSSFDLSNTSDPQLVSTEDLERGIETIFPYKNNLFIGSESGLFIYNIDNPSSPQFMSKFEHARACDPVFVEENIAYVTLRNGSTCQGFNNQLDIIDISNLQSPNLIASHNMINPHGLTVRNKQVLLCEGDSGLKIVDATDPRNVNLTKHIKDFHAYDIISLRPQHFMLIGEDGFYQYELSEDQNPNLLSHIPIVQ